MNKKVMADFEEKFIPGSDEVANDIFKFPFTVDSTTIECIKSHGRIMFIIRGLPGTGKNSLCNILIDRYPSSKVCSADSYFTETFNVTKERSRENLQSSHEYCQKRVESFCQKDVHPIIVKNTHVTKFEMQKYLDFAAKYNYTIIMARTIDKFKVSPEILAESNTKGLTVDYFKTRLSKWKEVTPILMGWFLGSTSSALLHQKLLICLDYLLGDGKFCRLMDSYQISDIREKYKVRKELFAIAACGPGNLFTTIRSHYFSTKVQKKYGQCFTITIQGFIVTPSYIVAVVHLDDTMKILYSVRTSPAAYKMDSVIDSFASLSVSHRNNVDNFEKHCKTVSFPDSADEPESDSTVGNGRINAAKSCFMVVAESASRKGKPHVPFDVVNEAAQSLRNIADADGDISPDQLRDFEDGYQFCRLSDQEWLLTVPTPVLYQSIFTGIYV